MNKNYYSLIVLCTFVLLTINVNAKIQTEKLPIAAAFIDKLAAKSPEHDGVVLREYAIQDINHDGVPEVLETFNTTEETAEGLLNVELSPAFSWINIYKLEKNQYIEKTKDFSWFLQKRKQFYQMWLSLLEKPDALSTDSKDLISKNKSKFKETLEKLKKKTE